MRLFIRFLPILFFACLSFGQTPRVYLKCDGDLTDSSAAGIITTITATGFESDR